MAVHEHIYWSKLSQDRCDAFVRYMLLSPAQRHGIGTCCCSCSDHVAHSFTFLNHPVIRTIQASKSQAPLAPRGKDAKDTSGRFAAQALWLRPKKKDGPRPWFPTVFGAGTGGWLAECLPHIFLRVCGIFQRPQDYV